MGCSSWKRLWKSSRSSICETVNFGGELDHVVVAELVEPLGVVADFGLVAVEDLEDLLFVGLGVERRSLRG